MRHRSRLQALESKMPGKDDLPLILIRFGDGEVAQAVSPGIGWLIREGHESESDFCLRARLTFDSQK